MHRTLPPRDIHMLRHLLLTLSGYWMVWSFWHIERERKRAKRERKVLIVGGHHRLVMLAASGLLLLLLSLLLLLHLLLTRPLPPICS